MNPWPSERHLQNKTRRYHIPQDTSGSLEHVLKSHHLLAMAFHIHTWEAGSCPSWIVNRHPDPRLSSPWPIAWVEIRHQRAPCRAPGLLSRTKLRIPKPSVADEAKRPGIPAHGNKKQEVFNIGSRQPQCTESLEGRRLSTAEKEGVDQVLGAALRTEKVTGQEWWHLLPLHMAVTGSAESPSPSSYKACTILK